MPLNPDDQIIMVHAQGNDSVSVRKRRRMRDDGQETYLVTLSPYDVLNAGYDEATVRLDQHSMDRLRHWLVTGEALWRDAVVPEHGLVDPRMAEVLDLAKHWNATDPGDLDEGAADLLDALNRALNIGQAEASKDGEDDEPTETPEIAETGDQDS